MKQFLKLAIPASLMIVTSIMMSQLILEFLAAVIFCVSGAFLLHAIIQLITDKTN